MTEEIEEGLEEEELTVIVVTKEHEEEIVWIREGKEFRYHGEMYDVINTRSSGDKDYYYCKNDTREKEVINRLVRHQKRKNNILLQLRKVLSDKYFPGNFSMDPEREDSGVRYPPRQDLYLSRFIEIHAPPPRFGVQG
jgi:hypothetical protein